jgi:peptidoglycan-N-acetylglucosamine deacetylase
MRFAGFLFFCLAVAGGSAAASAETCPGNPDALGTSRVLTISPSKFSQVGSMQYKQTLPLNDHDLVITFDDGRCHPIPTPFSISWRRNA